MCGIYLLLQRETAEAGGYGDDESAAPAVPPWLIRRGPDHQACVQWKLFPATQVTLQASVLSMRDQRCAQPVALLPTSHESTSERPPPQAYLCWNGEVYQDLQDSSEHKDSTKPLVGDSSVSDTHYVADLVRMSLSSTDDSQHAPEILLPKLALLFSRLVNAEFAFCLTTTDWIYYGKDPWGRRSLLTSSSSDGSMCLSSVSHHHDREGWSTATEVEPGIIFAYHVTDGSLQQLPYQRANTVALTRMAPASDPAVSPSQGLYQVLREAVRRRIAGNQPVAILFSGGLDSVVLAALVLQERAQVTLANVSFVKETKLAPPESFAADTKAALVSYKELQQLFPDAEISFCQRQVEWAEVEAEQARLEKLIAPKSTVMDVNIATALWFAATTVDARILLTGLGADEQMGGYGRHRQAWERGGAHALRHELQMDQGRLWERNLGRDDRVLSDSSKEARYPYLDTAVVNYLQHLNVTDLCDFGLPPGEGDKQVLRQVAHQLGLQAASTAVKRAIQFGSRIAHVGDKKRFGSRRKASGLAQYGQDGA